MADTTDEKVKELLTRYEAGERDFAGLDLYKANLRGDNLSGAKLSEADLGEAHLSEADLRGANLSGANLLRANFWGASIEKTDFRRAICGATVFGDVDLRLAVGLEEIVHQGPSTIGKDLTKVDPFFVGSATDAHDVAGLRPDLPLLSVTNICPRQATCAAPLPTMSACPFPAPSSQAAAT